MKQLLFIFGTRPEAIKLVPLIQQCHEWPGIHPVVCVTSQHSRMLHDVLRFFDIPVDVDLGIMTSGQSLSDITCRIVSRMPAIFKAHHVDMVVVQGDTNSTFSGALSAYYHGVPIAHVEAGLRTYQATPFPEEGNRRMTSHLSSMHFCPTESAVLALKHEGITRHVHHVGNTVVDALHMAKKRIPSSPPLPLPRVLVTCHRRENMGEPLNNLCKALLQLVGTHDSITIHYAMHANPAIQTVVRSQLANHPRIMLSDPLPYSDMIRALMDCTLVLTDSGGVQEEAACIGKPTLILREYTERMEGVHQEQARLVGTDPTEIVENTLQLLNNPDEYATMAVPSHVYGRGDTAKQIMRIITRFLSNDDTGYKTNQ